MKRSNDDPPKLKSMFLTVLSVAALVVFGWFFFYGKVKAQTWLAPLLNRLPKNEAGVVETTDNILGAAIERIRSGGTLKKAAEQGSAFFENSDYAAPARDIRENVKDKVTEVVDSVKELPAKEVRVVQEQVCRSWFPEGLATPNATPSGEQ